MTDILMEVDVPTIPLDKCQEMYSKRPGVINPSVICAGFEEGVKDSCNGDSGGPLLQFMDGVPVLYGITSWGDGCARSRQPGVYTRVSHFTDWIDSIIEKHGQKD